MQMETPKLNPDWAELTPEQKRQQRIDRYLNPIGINFVNDEARKQYQIRAQRYVDVYNFWTLDKTIEKLDKK